MTSATSNFAAWQLEPKGAIVLKEAEFPEPGPGEIRVKVRKSIPAHAEQLI